MLGNLKFLEKITEKQPPVEITVIDDNKDLPDFRKIAIPDLKKYIADGYDEIRKVKEENDTLEKKVEHYKEFEQLYNAALITTNEFKNRDEENQNKILELKQRIDMKDDEIRDLNEIINTYKIQEYEFNKQQEEFEKNKETFEINLRNEIKEELMHEIDNTKGHLGKTKIHDIISNIK